MNEHTAPGRPDEAHIAQNPQVLGDGALGDIEHSSHCADAEGRICDELDDAQAHPDGECSEQTGGLGNVIHAALMLTMTVMITVLPGWAQQVPSHTMHGRLETVPVLPGQDAFGAIQEVVRILEADPATDWSKVDPERLRQHLVDMNEVTLHAAVKAEPIPGGLRMDITGTGRTEKSIRAMVGPHTIELNQMEEWSARAETIPSGIRLVVVAKDPTDVKTVARVRGLGFIGLLVQGAHHQPHHLAMARGETISGHSH